MTRFEEGASSVNMSALRRLVARRALTRSCPQCGRSGMYVGYARLRPSCTECELIFRRDQGAQTGSMYLTAAVTQVFTVTVISLMWWLLDWPVKIHVVVALPIVAGFCVWFLPRSQALWVGIDYLTDAANGEEWVQPRD